MDVLKLAELGWRLIAMQRGSKNPGSLVGEGWPAFCTTEPETLRAWGANRNWGVLLGPSSGIIDLEYDSDEGKEIIEAACTGLVTPTYKSAKSVHRLFKWDARFENERAKFGWRGTEWRFGQDGAQSVIPPSLHDTGVLYEWMITPHVPVAPLPESLWTLYKSLYTEFESTRAKAPAADAHRDYGSDTIINLARTELDKTSWSRLLEAKGWTFARLRGEAQDWRRPGKKSGSLSATVNYGGSGRLAVFSTGCKPLEEDKSYDKFGFVCLLDYQDDPIKAAKAILPQSILDDLDHKWQAAQAAKTYEFESTFSPDNSRPGITKAIVDPGPFPDDCLLPPGFIADVAKYTLATSNEPQPMLALGGAMCLLATLTGRKITNLVGNRTNIFVLGLGPSGCGKDRPRKVNVDILTKILHTEFLGANSVGSGHGFESQLKLHPAKLFQLDEIGDLLRSIKRDASGNGDTLVGKLKMLMTSADTLYSNSATADSKSFFTIDQPHLVVFGTSTPDKFWDNLSPESVGDGLMGRMFPFEVVGYARTQKPVRDEIPEAILEQARAWADFHPGGTMAQEHPTPSVYVYTDEAEARHDKYCSDIDAKVPTDGTHEKTDGIWKRARGRAAILALLFAASRQGPSHFGRIELIDVDLAIKITNWVTRKTIYKISTQMSENQFQKDCNRVQEILTKNPLDRTQLCNKTPWLRRKERNEVLEHLIERGAVGVEEIKSKTNTKLVYKVLI